MTALTVAEAARALEIPQGRLRRWIRTGCPVAQRGRRGRGGATLIDAGAVREWREAQSDDALVLALASSLQDVLGDATVKAYMQTTGFDNRRRLARVFVATYYVCACAVRDRLQKVCSRVPPINSLPASIERLKQIAEK